MNVKTAGVMGAVMALLCTPRLSAQTCTPTPSEDLGQPSAPGAFYTLGAVVPQGEAWIVRAAGIGYSTPMPGNPVLEYSLNILHPVAPYTTSENIATDGGCCWQIPAQTAVKTGTPVLALDHAVTLLPGERLLARVTSPPPTLVMNLFVVLWKVPVSCLSAAVLR